ncbi:MAG: hypothetical protein BGO01_10870 [Armatimonadetes bacterium 55-13]|nr:MAG: hypothetical protein BGO01_10870 [Armatimonadetes bacterium 55-13]
MYSVGINLLLSLGLLSAASVLANPTPGNEPQDSPPFEGDIEHFEKEDATQPPTKGGIVFVGSSSIRLWHSLKTDFPYYNTINRGFGGSQVSDSVRYANRIVTPYKPRIIVFFAGTNDIADGKSAETVERDFEAFVGKVRAKLPSTPIVYISISPAPSRWNKIAEIMKANGLIEKYTEREKGLIFMDVFKSMLTKDGGPRPELFVEDKLHLNAHGYAIWRRALGPILDRLTEDQKLH